jgi:hypothetical protein
MNRENFTPLDNTSCFPNVVPSKLAQEVTSLISISKLLGSDPGRNTDNPDCIISSRPSVRTLTYKYIIKNVGISIRAWSIVSWIRKPSQQMHLTSHHTLMMETEMVHETSPIFN